MASIAAGLCGLAVFLLDGAGRLDLPFFFVWLGRDFSSRGGFSLTLRACACYNYRKGGAVALSLQEISFGSALELPDVVR